MHATSLVNTLHFYILNTLVAFRSRPKDVMRHTWSNFFINVIIGFWTQILKRNNNLNTILWILQLVILHSSTRYHHSLRFPQHHFTSLPTLCRIKGNVMEEVYKNVHIAKFNLNNCRFQEFLMKLCIGWWTKDHFATNHWWGNVLAQI